MSVMRLIAVAVVCTGLAAPVSADVTLRMTMVEKEIDGRVTNVTEYRKGLKVRTDSSGAGSSSVSTIVDTETGLVFELWHDGKGAVVYDLNKMAALAKDSVAGYGIDQADYAVTSDRRVDMHGL